MSESGKVSLPEIDYTRLQSIRDKHLRMDKEIFWNELEVKPGSLHGDRACLLGIIDYYMAALEKAEKEKDKAIDLLGDNLDDKAALIDRYGKEITELRDRLYEANQDAETEQKLNDILHETNKELRKKLSEAQQTIARQREVLDFYANQEHWELPSFGRGQSMVTSDRGSKARELLKEVTTMPVTPNCPTCGNQHPINHPSRPGIYLCVPCDYVYEEGSDKA